MMIFRIMAGIVCMWSNILLNNHPVPADVNIADTSHIFMDSFPIARNERKRYPSGFHARNMSVIPVKASTNNGIVMKSNINRYGILRINRIAVIAVKRMIAEKRVYLIR